jgi:hypothetical protein
MAKTKLGFYDLPPKGGYSPNRKQIKKMTPKYETIMNWLIENPTAPIRDCAEYFGVTTHWMRSIINSDAFRARLNERQETVFSTLTLDLREKLHGAAHEAIERLTDKISTIEDPKLLLDAVDKLFTQLGYTGKTNAASPAHYLHQQNTIVNVGSDQIAEARLIMDRALELKEPIQPQLEATSASAEPVTTISPPPEPRSGEGFTQDINDNEG